mgnify:CR=1 FL=1
MATILYFSTTTCGPCKMFKPIVTETLGSRVVYVDAQQSPDLASKYGVTAVPTMIVAEGNTVLKRHTGVMSKQQLVQFASNA